MASPLGYLMLLAATLLVEAPVAAALAGHGRRRDAVLASLALNLVSHPLAVGVTWLLPASWLPVELAVVAAEALGYRALVRANWARVVLLSVAANLASALVGIALVHS